MKLEKQLVSESDKSQSKKCNLDPATKKPPEGLRPRAIVDAKRKLEIEEALWRYIAAEKAIPCKWVQEYLDLLQRYEVKPEPVPVMKEL